VEPTRGVPQAELGPAGTYPWQGENGELYAWDGQRWVLEGKALVQAPPEPQHEKSHQQALQQNADYTGDGPNSEQYVWNGQAWILTNPGYAASPQQPQPEPQQQVNDRGELVYTWQGADGQMYVWDPRLEQWIAQGYQAR